MNARVPPSNKGKTAYSRRLVVEEQSTRYTSICSEMDNRTWAPPHVSPMIVSSTQQHAYIQNRYGAGHARSRPGFSGLCPFHPQDQVVKPKPIQRVDGLLGFVPAHEVDERKSPRFTRLSVGRHVDASDLSKGSEQHLQLGLPGVLGKVGDAHGVLVPGSTHTFSSHSATSSTGSHVRGHITAGFGHSRRILIWRCFARHDTFVSGKVLQIEQHASSRAHFEPCTVSTRSMASISRAFGGLVWVVQGTLGVDCAGALFCVPCRDTCWSNDPLSFRRCDTRARTCWYLRVRRVHPVWSVASRRVGGFGSVFFFLRACSTSRAHRSVIARNASFLRVYFFRLCVRLRLTCSSSCFIPSFLGLST